MSAVTIQQMADRVAALMESRLRVKGRTLSQKLRYGAWLLPRTVRREARALARFAEMAKNPKLLMQVDEAQVAQAYDVCLRHLNNVNVWDRRKSVFSSIAQSILWGLASVMVVVLLLLVWRGYL
jgi:hypothetical protein